MTVKVFAAELARSLMACGVEKEDAVAHVITLVKTLTEDDLKEITGYRTRDDFKELSESLADIIKNKRKTKSRREDDGDFAPDSHNGTKDKTGSAAELTASENKSDSWSYPQGENKSAASKVQTVQDETKTFKVTPVSSVADKEQKTTPSGYSPTIEIPAVDDTPQEIFLGDDSTVKEKTVMTLKGKAIFWIAAIVASPLWLAVLAVVASLFAVSVCAVCAFTAFAFVLVLAEVAAGGSGFFVGLIYGVIQIFGHLVGTGLYEIGIGTVLLGVTVILSAFTYHFATKTLPYVLKELLLFWGVAARRTGMLIVRFREGCNSL